MKKYILPLKIITIAGMITSMVLMLVFTDNETLTKSIIGFMVFGFIGVFTVLIEEKVKSEIVE